MSSRGRSSVSGPKSTNAAESPVQATTRLPLANPSVPPARTQLGVVLCLILLAIAHFAANYAATTHREHSLAYWQAVFSFWLSHVLVITSLCVYILRSPSATNSFPVAWTFSYVAFLTHVYWSVFGIFRGHAADIFHASRCEAVDPEKVVESPVLDVAFTLLWGLDVFLSWLHLRNIESFHGFVRLSAFIMFFGSTVLAAKASLVAFVLGLVMTLLVSVSFCMRLAMRETDERSFSARIFVWFFQLLNFVFPWYRLPTLLAVLNLEALRIVLRAQNLHDTSKIKCSRPAGVRLAPTWDAKFLCERHPDGYFNDMVTADMGCSSLNPRGRDSSDFELSAAGARFGRNVPLSEAKPGIDGALLDPNPRLISNRLLKRTTFQPASTLNLLAAAWIQFQTHDWFNHGYPVRGDEFSFDPPQGDSWPSCPMRIRRTRPDPTRKPDDGETPTFVNGESHWWDGSQIYGSTHEATHYLREKRYGHLKPTDPATHPQFGEEITGLTANWWIGLSLLHNLFVLEHNAICDRLRVEYPNWTDDDYYRVARVVNTALMAKIHTVDWTTAILAHPALEIGMNANWWGLASEKVTKLVGRISESEAISGIPGSATKHHGADYCLTEEFVSVYRMHPLMPDSIDVRFAATGKLLKTVQLGTDDTDDLVGPEARSHADQLQVQLVDLVYSFGIANPGAITLHNYPDWMRRLKRRKGLVEEEIIDLAAVDIMRDRERGVPRYNRFRKLFHLPPIKSFEELNPEFAAELREIYHGDIDLVDLMVGLYAEKPPEGFGFSDTAFRVFILMASRRLKSDRFFTEDYNAHVYTQPGIAWVQNNCMKTVLLRHYPQLGPALRGVQNAFKPWRNIGS